MNHSLEAYRAFYHVGKTGSITRAAEALCVSQPAVSQAIKQLEAQLGVSLCTRTAKGMRLTVEGQTLYPYIERAFSELIQGEKQLQRMLELDTGEITVGASDMTLQFYLLPYLEQFHETYPGIKVIVTNAPTPETMQYLQEGKIDFGLISEPFADVPDIESVPVKEIADIFVAGSKFRYLHGKKLDYKLLEQMPLICLEQNTSTRRFMDNFLEARQIKAEPEFELATSDMIVQFALRNMGIGCVVEDFAREQIEQDILFPLNFQFPMPKRHICLVYKNESAMSSASKRLKDLLLKEQI